MWTCKLTNQSDSQAKRARWAKIVSCMHIMPCMQALCTPMPKSS
jgi:hypothetical protein